MSVGIGSALEPLISPAVVENMSMSGSGVSHAGILPGEPLPFTVYTFYVPFGPRFVEKNRQTRNLCGSLPNAGPI